MSRRWETKPEDPIRLEDFRSDDRSSGRQHKPASAAWVLLWLLPIVVAIVIIFTRLFNHIIVWS